ncbi:MAG TPA: tetraacyldisaccharide 4'-kinase [Bryobacteraceae bacterium]|nr:tetraacyldisaccharide 4'-kinase [Bryobacteraceae bacterium]
MRRAKRLKTKGIYFLYRVLQAFGLPIVLLYFLFRGARNRGYWRSLPQRFGFLPGSFRQTGPGAIWLHAVSVGEVLSCVELLRRLRPEFPNSRLFVSVSTLAGHATAGEKLRGLADGVFYAPVDYVFAVRRVLRALQPSVVVVAETELWPNLFREVKRTGAALTLVNGRISDRAFPRYRLLRWFFSVALAELDSILVQTAEIGERFVALGALPGRVEVAGSIKYDFEPRPLPADSPLTAWLERAKPEKVWIAASTMPPADAGDVDEDDVVIAAFRELNARHPGLALVLAPRKPERFAVAAEKLEAAGIPYLRRSALAAYTGGLPRVLLLDSIGELSALFDAATVVFMGGTLASRGGHNILEPALFAKPVITGPHMENFQAIAHDFRAANACVEIAGAAGLVGAVERLLAEPEEARAIGRRALACAESRRGATARAVEEIRKLYRRQVPVYRLAMPWYAVALVLARLWEWGARRRRQRQSRRARRLPVPVISVGNLSMGGTGKTPAVLRLAEILKERGSKPAILTRGYGRNSPDDYLAAAPGASVSPDQTGDEAQILIRSGVAPVGVGADRFVAGTRLLQQFDIRVLLLDDGFQHWKLARDVDVVLIDALRPFGGGGVFPLGRLREPIESLARPGVVVITRAEASDLADAIEATVRRYNPDGLVFRASVEPLAWVEHATGKQLSLAERPFERAGAFCGLGNPETFRRTLERLGVQPVDWIEFDDHHRYRPREMQHLAHQVAARGAMALVTTEKDAVNLCESCSELVAPLSLYWLRVGMRVEREEELMREVERRISGDCAPR